MRNRHPCVKRIQYLPSDEFRLTFRWGDYYKELDQKAPLSRIATSIVKHNDHRNKGTHHIPGVCMAIAILLKERNREMCSIQSLLLLILFQSRAEKGMYAIINDPCALIVILYRFIYI